MQAQGRLVVSGARKLPMGMVQRILHWRRPRPENVKQTAPQQRITDELGLARGVIVRCVSGS